MRVVGDSGVEFDLDDNVATSMISSGHIVPVDPDEVDVNLIGEKEAADPLAEWLAALERRVAALEGAPADVVLGDGSTPPIGDDGILTAGTDATEDPSVAATGEPDGVQSGPVEGDEPETGPATAEAQDILHDTKPEPKRTRARKPATDES